MTINELKRVYFLGIGGIGMSALARYFINIGVGVYGYDLTPTDITDNLAREGAIIHFDENILKCGIKVLTNLKGNVRSFN